MAPLALTLPPTFNNSFWTQDYRKGLEVLFNKLEQGLAENDEIVQFIRARIVAENNLAASLSNPGLTGPKGQGFDADDGASLFMTFMGLKQESIAQGQVHLQVATDLQKDVVEPFYEWAEKHRGRILGTRQDLIEGWLRTYELTIADVAKLKQTYVAKARRADELEDDAKFAPNNDFDKYTPTSPRVNQTNGAVKRTPSVSERIAQRLKDLRKGEAAPVPADHPATADTAPPAEPKDDNAPANSENPVETESEKKDEEVEDEGEKRIPAADKGKGKAVDEVASPTPMSPPQPPSKLDIPKGPQVKVPPIVLAGVPFSPATVSAMLTRAETELPLRPVRFPILGEYPDCFTGEEFVTWLKESVKGFNQSLDRAEIAATELTERENLLRRIGELGNKFENSREAFYQFRDKAFELETEHRPAAEESIISPINLTPVASNIVKRSNTFANFVVKTLGQSNTEPPHIRARAEAEAAEKSYKTAVRNLDRQRLGLEDRIEDALKALQRWEMDRLRAVKTVLLQYQGTLANIPQSLGPSYERSSTLLSTYQPESDLVALIERYRTGPFKPAPHVFESIAHEGTDVVFGIDLRKWAGEGGWNAVRAGGEKEAQVPNVVKSLLTGLDEAYKGLPNDAERRKTWIYEVPLPAVHHLREAINKLPPDSAIPPELLGKYDAAVLASTLKLWLLELDPPIGLYEGWDDVRKLFPTVGAQKEVSEEDHIEALRSALQRLPKVHLVVLDTILAHLTNLINTTESEEPKEVYITKLALSMGRSILRPKFENQMSVQDRHPTLLFIDLVKHYTEILPQVIAKKKRESMERPMPLRKRTAPVDMRIHRGSIGGASDTRGLLAVREAQIQERSRPPSRATSPELKSPPPVPPIPIAVPPPAPAEEVTPTAAKPDTTGRPQFVEPKSDSEEEKATPVKVSPPTPKPTSPEPRVDSPPPAPRSPPPSDQNRPLSQTAASLSRSSSGEASRLRGPRTVGARGPRAAPGAAAPRATQSPSPSANRNSISSLEGVSRPRSTANPSDYAPRKQGGRVQAGAFSRRTMASGSEDEVVDK